MVEQTLHVRILSPQQLILETEAYAISSKSSIGNFDILVQHANFITVVENQPIIIRIKNKPQQIFKFPIAIILVSNNKVNIYTYVTAEKNKSSSNN